MSDSRRWPLAGYLSALPEYSDRHPETLLPLADRIIAYLAELADPDAAEGQPCPECGATPAENHARNCSFADWLDGDSGQSIGGSASI